MLFVRANRALPGTLSAAILVVAGCTSEVQSSSDRGGGDLSTNVGGFATASGGRTASVAGGGLVAVGGHRGDGGTVKPEAAGSTAGSAAAAQGSDSSHVVGGSGSSNVNIPNAAGSVSGAGTSSVVIPIGGTTMGGAHAASGSAGAHAGNPIGGGPTSGGGTASGGGAASGGTASSGTASGGGGAASAAGAGGELRCNLVIGNSTTQQWFDNGFLSYPGIDAKQWELYWVAHHYIDAWANPKDAGWSTAFDNGHQCSAHAKNPDRVVFVVTYAPPYPAEAVYRDYLVAVVKNIKSKYATARRIELTTLVRSPGNLENACSSKVNNEQSIPAAEDAAIAAVAAMPEFAALVFALPPFYVPKCADFVADAPQFTSAGATDVAKIYGAYFAAHP